MNREDFLDTLREQYAEEIYEAYLECSHQQGDFDKKELETRLQKILKTAKVDGLTEGDLIDLIQAELPADVFNALSVGVPVRRVA